MDIQTAALRFGITFLLAFIFGIERQREHKPVGFGTFSFVSVGSCGLALVATDLYSNNPLPLLAAIVTGIGFLGAGALIKTTDKIFGFTTAASIWLFAIIGLIVGVGEYNIALMIYILVWIVIIVDKILQIKGIGSYQKKLIITTKNMITEQEVDKLFDEFKTKHKLIGVEMDKTNNKSNLIYLIEGTRDNINKLAKKLYEQKWLASVKSE
ncbi:MgtC/SapB family protein [Candidatus Woesearchaeota archaeon]|nr:MgtC/SapB family protein [Candidatus Woesearchaeota archaeon]